MSQQTATLIKDSKIEPYYIKLVNSSYEVHQEHTPKTGGEKYSKLVCTKDTIRSAIMSIVKRKLALNRKTKKTIALQEYLDEFKELKNLTESILIDDDSPERQIRLLKRRMDKFEKELESLKPKEVEVKGFANSEVPLLKF